MAFLGVIYGPRCLLLHDAATWEGWDEYAHFAWLEHWNTKGTLPWYDTPVSREIEMSLELTPLTEELKWLGPDHFTCARWRALLPTERAERSARLASLQGELRGVAPRGPGFLRSAATAAVLLAGGDSGTPGLGLAPAGTGIAGSAP